MGFYKKIKLMRDLAKPLTGIPTKLLTQEKDDKSDKGIPEVDTVSTGQD